MLSTGVDILHVPRVAEAIARHGARFLARVYTPAEIAYCRGRAPELAARFAAKEAVAKALGVGMRVLSRQFAANERSVLQRAYVDLQAHYESHLGDAKKLIRVGDTPADAKLPEAEFAAWTMLASNVLNLDEALNK